MIDSLWPNTFILRLKRHLPSRVLFSFFALYLPCLAETDHPYYRRPSRAPQNLLLFNQNHIDLAWVHLPPYQAETLASAADLVPVAQSLYDGRAAATIASIIGDPAALKRQDLLESHIYHLSDPPFDDFFIDVLSPRSLGVMAYSDYFPDSALGYRARGIVSDAITDPYIVPGWCGSFGPAPGTQGQSNGNEGNYDMTQMHMIALVYRYYDELTPNARDKLITVLLKKGRIERPNESDTLTSARPPADWSRAGYAQFVAKAADIPETENHDVMILTARYLTNQLLYQRDPNPDYDNHTGAPNCNQLLSLILQNILRDDFAEYNAKNYQEETRYALLNLNDFAYDSEIRLGAKMVLDYISARVAVSSCDLRRFVPFRRRDEPPNNQAIAGDARFLDVGLSSYPNPGTGADPTAPYFALMTGNARAFELAEFPARPWKWGINPHSEYAIQALSDYRIPNSLLDFFVNDRSRRFFQRLHRIVDQRGLVGGDHLEEQRNCNNMESYAGSPSYLISAGGRPARWVINGHLVHESYQQQNIGVAMPSSLMPTGKSSGGPISRSTDVIQVGQWSDDFEDDVSAGDHGGAENYGVAPDFICGNCVYLPGWISNSADPPVSPYGNDAITVTFVDRGPSRQPEGEKASFYLAIWRHPPTGLSAEEGEFTIIEAFDTWLHPNVQFNDFKARVLSANRNLVFHNNAETQYTTQNGNRVHFFIWTPTYYLTYDQEGNPYYVPDVKRDNHYTGSSIKMIEYGAVDTGWAGAGDPLNTLEDAGNDNSRFLSGTVMKSPGEGIVEINNSFLSTKITLDFSIDGHPRRKVEVDGVVTEYEEGGGNYEVWVDFASPVNVQTGDFFHPYKTLGAAKDAVADGGVIKIKPGTTGEKPIINVPKRMTLVAPLGDVHIGSGP